MCFNELPTKPIFLSKPLSTKEHEATELKYLLPNDLALKLMFREIQGNILIQFSISDYY